MMLRARMLVLLLAAACALALGCRREESALGKPETPLVLVLSPAHGKSPAAVQRLEQFLGIQSGLAVEVRVAKDAEEAVRMAGSPNTDAALLTLFEYLFARKEFGVEAGLRVVRAGGELSHQGEILVATDSALKSLADLEGKRIAYVDRYSTTGFLLPAKKLADAKVRAQTQFAGSHAEAIAALKSGRVDAAAVYVGAAKGDPKLRSITTTDRIPNEPVFFRAGLPRETRDKLTAALRAFAATDDGRATLQEMADVTGFTSVSDRDYDAAFSLVQAAGKSVKDLVPRGWLLANERELGPADLAP